MFTQLTTKIWIDFCWSLKFSKIGYNNGYSKIEIGLEKLSCTTRRICKKVKEKMVNKNST